RMTKSTCPSRYPPLVSALKSRASVAGSHETYVILGAPNATSPRITPSPNPLRGGSTTTRSIFNFPPNLFKYCSVVARTAFTFEGELYSRSAWEVGDDSTAITCSNSQFRNEEN